VHLAVKEHRIHDYATGGAAEPSRLHNLLILGECIKRHHPHSSRRRKLHHMIGLFDRAEQAKSCSSDSLILRPCAHYPALIISLSAEVFHLCANGCLINACFTGAAGIDKLTLCLQHFLCRNKSWP